MSHSLFSKQFFITSILVLLAILAPFFFSWPYALGLGILSSLFFPPIAILNGALIDTLYYGAGASHGSHVLPYFTILGCVIAMIAFSVQQFIKTRIMS